MVLIEDHNPFLKATLVETLSAIAAEDIGIPTVPATWPKQPYPYTAGHPLRISGFDTTLQKIKVSKSTKVNPLFFGVSQTKAEQDEEITVRIEGICLFATGTKDIAVGSLVRFDTDGSAEDGDIIGAGDSEQISHIFSSTIAANGTFSIGESVSYLISAVFFDDSAGTTTVLTVVDDDPDITGNNISIVSPPSSTLRIGFQADANDKLFVYAMTQYNISQLVIGRALAPGYARTGTGWAGTTVIPVLINRY